MNRVPTLFFLAAAVLSSPLLAQTADRQPTIQVTATRLAQTIDDTLAAVTVITRDDIEASGAHDVIDLLRMQPGVDIYRTGGAGSQMSILLRGVNANHVLTLVDGLRVNSANTGAYAFDHLALDTIERIEIVRGPRASFWGSEAIGGVVHIFTRKLDGPRAALGYGSYGDAAGAAGFGHWAAQGGFSVQAGAREVRGFSATNESICNGPDDPWCIHDPDDDGFSNRNIVLRAARQLGAYELDASAARSHSSSDFDQGVTDGREQTVSLSLAGPVRPGWDQRIDLGHVRQTLDTAVFSTHYYTRRSNLGWRNTWQLAQTQQLAAGVEVVREEGANINSATGVPNYSGRRNNQALYAGWFGHFAAVDAELALRHDHNGDFGNKTTGSAALGWNVGDALRIWASVADGFRAPNLNEQFSPGFGGLYAGNPSLDAETSRSAELGIEYTPDRGHRLSGNLYRTDVSDLISFTGVDYQAINIARARIDGLEAGYDYSSGPWAAGVNYSWLDPVDRDSGMWLLRRARHKSAGFIERSFAQGLRLGVELTHSGSRMDVGDARLSGYTLLNMRADAQLNENWRVSARLENIADRNYELVRGYNTPGRSGFVQLIWEPR